ncbi:MAG: sigma-70 family RNA polymerase sigma factor [Planctomycetes bacterium]|nr:sigma-70 family RNA polymerase sigma factor [Planctomycetota bacterium]
MVPSPPADSFRPSAADRAFREFQCHGDPEAFARVFDAEAPALSRLAQRLLHDPASAEDVVQRTFLIALEHPEHWHPNASVGRWLAGILRNEARREWRRRGRCPDPVRLDSPAIEPDTVHRVLASEQRERIDAALHRLTPAQREVIRMHLLDGMPLGQVAAALDRPRHTVKSQYRRGLARLRQVLPAGALAVPLCGRPGFAQLRHTVLAAARARTRLTLGGLLLRAAAILLVTIGLALAVASAFRDVPTSATPVVATDPVPPAPRSEAVERNVARDAIPAPPPSEQSVDSVRSAGMRVSGTVRSASGAPVAGAGIWMCTSDDLTSGQVVTTSDSVGRFTLDCVPPGTKLAARANGHGTGAFVYVLPTATPRECTLDLVPESTLHGRVFGPDGTPMAGTTLLLGYAAVAHGEPGSVPCTATSGIDGRFVLRGASATTETPLWVRGPNSAVWARPIRLSTGENRAMTIKLPRAGRAVGVVRDGQGRAIAGATVEQRCLALEPPPGAPFLGPSWARSTTASTSDGSYTLPDATPGRCVLEARLAGRFATLRIDLPRAKELRWDPQLGDGLELSGRVMTDTGHPVAGWVIRATGDAGARDPGSTRTAIDGSFRLGGCAAGTYLVAARPDIPGFVTGPWRRCRAHAGAPVSITVPADALPRAAARARIHGERGPHEGSTRLTLIDFATEVPLTLEVMVHDGRFAHPALPSGRFRLAVQAGDRTIVRDEVRLVAGECVDLGALRLRALGTLTARVRGPEGQVVTTTATVTDSSGVARGIPINRGTIAAHRLPAGDYEIAVVEPRLGLAYAAFSIRAGETADIELRTCGGETCSFLAPPVRRAAVRARFAIRDAAGGLLYRQHVVATNRTHAHLWTTCLPTGSYELRVTDSATDRTESCWFDVRPGTEPTKVVTMPMPHRVRGRAESIGATADRR